MLDNGAIATSTLRRSPGHYIGRTPDLALVLAT